MVKIPYMGKSRERKERGFEREKVIALRPTSIFFSTSSLHLSIDLRLSVAYAQKLPWTLVGNPLERGLLRSSVHLLEFKMPQEFFYVFLPPLPLTPESNTLIYISWHLGNSSCNSWLGYYRYLFTLLCCYFWYLSLTIFQFCKLYFPFFLQII